MVDILEAKVTKTDKVKFAERGAFGTQRGSKWDPVLEAALALDNGACIVVTVGEGNAKKGQQGFSQFLQKKMPGKNKPLGYRSIEGRDDAFAIVKKGE